METKTTGNSKCPVISYDIYGSGNAIILLHGFPLDGDIWKKVAGALAKHYMVIVPDLPGAGNSSFEGDELSMEEMAEAVKTVMDAEKIEKAVVCGHSMGGYAALAFADAHVERVVGLGLIHSSTTADTEEKKEQRRKSVELFKKGGKGAFIRQMIPTLFSAVNKETYADEIKEITERAIETPEKSMVAFYNAMINRPERSSTLKNGNYPVLWAMGEDDTIMPINNLMQQTSYASVNFVEVMAQCGHMAMIENPSLLSSHIATFAAYCYR